MTWFASDAFGSPNNYTNCPVGAVCYVNEPDEPVTLDGTYFGVWESGFNFAMFSYNSRNPLFPGFYLHKLLEIRSLPSECAGNKKMHKYENNVHSFICIVDSYSRYLFAGDLPEL